MVQTRTIQYLKRAVLAIIVTAAIAIFLPGSVAATTDDNNGGNTSGWAVDPPPDAPPATAGDETPIDTPSSGTDTEIVSEVTPERAADPPPWQVIDSPDDYPSLPGDRDPVDNQNDDGGVVADTNDGTEPSAEPAQVTENETDSAVDQSASEAPAAEATDPSLLGDGTTDHANQTRFYIGPQVDDSGVLVVPLAEVAGSGISGSATLTTEGDMLRVVLDLVGYQPDTSVGIYSGLCGDNNRDLALSLEEPDANGHSETLLAVSIDDLLAKPHSIIVYRQVGDASVESACGTIAPTQAAESSGDTAGAAAETAITNTGVGISAFRSTSHQPLLAILSVVATLATLAASLLRWRRAESIL